MDEENGLKEMTSAKVDGKRPRARPRKDGRTTSGKNQEELGISEEGCPVQDKKFGEPTLHSRKRQRKSR